VDNQAEFRPKLRAEILFGPPEVKGKKIVHYVKDQYTDQFYRLGEKEHFLLNEMDGQRTLPEIAQNYGARFGKELDERAWAGLFKLLDARQMLEGRTDPAKLAELAEKSERLRNETKSWLTHRFRLINPNQVLESLLPWVRFMFRPWVFLSGILLIVVTEVWVLMHIRTIGHDSWMTRRDWHILVIFFCLLFTSSLIHETAHGLTCKYFGGTVKDMGLVWRYFWIFPYCKLDHIVLFHQRRQRISVAFAGTYASMLLLMPFAALWWFTAPATLWHVIAAKMLTLYSLVALLNFIPFVQLDGYFMLAHALGMSDLRKESYAFIKKVILGQNGWDEEYNMKEKRVYAVYGLLSMIITVCLIGGVALFWQSVIARRLGSTRAWVIVAVVLVTSVAGKLMMKWMKKVVKEWWASYRGQHPATS
jgi:putative peptide zinc metalloprotease protein